VLRIFTGCIGTSKEEEEKVEFSERPTLPIPQDQAKQSPSIPIFD